MNNVEETVYNALTKEYGSIWDEVEESVGIEKLALSKQLYDTTSKVFLSNPSAYNYNFLLTAMLTYQYWQAKRTKCFTLEAEF